MVLGALGSFCLELKWLLRFWSPVEPRRRRALRHLWLPKTSWRNLRKLTTSSQWLAFWKKKLFFLIDPFSFFFPDVFLLDFAKIGLLFFLLASPLDTPKPRLPSSHKKSGPKRNKEKQKPQTKNRNYNYNKKGKKRKNNKPKKPNPKNKTNGTMPTTHKTTPKWTITKKKKKKTKTKQRNLPPPPKKKGQTEARHHLLPLGKRSVLGIQTMGSWTVSSWRRMMLRWA